MTDRPDDLTVEVQRRGGVTVLTACGILDFFHAKFLQSPLEDAVQEPGSRVVVDLSEVRFVDSTGLAMLVGADHAARGSGGRLRLAGATPQMRRMLATTNLDRLFELHDTVAGALEAE